MTTDVIRLIGLGGVGRHGVLPEERRDGQLFKVDLVLSVDTSAAAATDDLGQTVDYAAVASEVVGLIEGEPVRLIETLASRVADQVLSHDGVASVEVTMHKPEAPVGVPFDDVQVTIVRDTPSAAAPAAPAAEPEVAAPAAPEPAPAPAQLDRSDLDTAPREPVEAVLALGGNLGDVRATLRAAITDLAQTDGIELLEVAPLAKTAAVLQPDAVAQPDFLNTVVVVRTTLAPRELLARTQAIETAHGRVRTDQRWGERTLDIDIITFGTVASPDPDLSLPHPRANERAFVLVPWAQLDPDAFLPGLGGGPVAALADTAPDRDGVRWLALDWYEPHGAAPTPAAEPALQPEDPVEPPATSRVDTGAALGARADDAADVVEPEHPADPEPDPTPEPEPDPTPEPEPDPTPEPEPDAVVEPDSSSQAVPEPEQAAPEPEQPEPEPEPSAAEPEDVPPVPKQPAAESSRPAAESSRPAAESSRPAAEPEQRDAQPEGADRPAPWEQPAPDAGATRIRPQWAPIRRDGS